jgi:transposase
LEPFRKLAASIDQHVEAILNSLVHELSNARVESLNTRNPAAHPARLRLP